MIMVLGDSLLANKMLFYAPLKTLVVPSEGSYRIKLGFFQDSWVEQGLRQGTGRVA